jgi:thiol-disulfide isomerase/thioredoxin
MTPSFRLLLLAGLTLLACDDKKPAAGALPPSRVVAVKAAKDEGTAALCDVQNAASNAPQFSLPAIEESGVVLTKGMPRWVNVWATWCPPCVEELSLLSKFASARAAAGKALSLTLISVDASRDVIERFALAHPEAKPSLRARDPNAIEAWLPSVGLDAGATLPIHLFVDAEGRVRCVRTGSIGDTDLPRIEKLLEAL